MKRKMGTRSRALVARSVLSVALVLVIEGRSHAQAESGDPSRSEQRAAELFREGRALREQQRHAEACERFRQSLAFKVARGTLMNVGACFVHENDPVSALETFERALALAQKEPDSAKRKSWSELAQQEIDALRGQVAEVALRFSPTPDLQIHLNDKLVQSESWRLRVVPGSYQLRAAAKGRVPYTRSFTAAAGARLELSIPPLQPTAQPSEPVVVDESAKPGAPVFPWVLIGTGSAVVVAGAITGLVTAGKASELEDNCPGKVCLDESQYPGGQDKIDDSKSLAMVTNVLWGVGLATLGVGVGLLVFGDDDEQAPATTAEVQAGCFVGSCGMRLEGRF